LGNFYRVTVAVPNTIGTGLGLSIAQEIVQAYGGSLDLSDGLLGGLRVTLELPHPGFGSGQSLLF
jgi:signal transduction histidine kinase